MAPRPFGGNRGRGRAILESVADGRTSLVILCVEGAIAGAGGTGRYQMLSGTGHSLMHWVQRIAGRARHVVAVGTCAAYGAGSARQAATRPMPWVCNMTALIRAVSATHVAERFGRAGDQRGRLPHPSRLGDRNADDASRGESVALDGYGRPRFYADHLVHHGCPKNEFYEYKASAHNLSEQGCMMEKPRLHRHPGRWRLQHQAVEWRGSCTRAGYPCINCTAPLFEDPRHAFVETPKIAGIPVGLPTDMPKAWFMALASLSRPRPPTASTSTPARTG